MSKLKSKHDIQKMREAGRLAGLTLEEISRHIHPGISTEALDRVAYDFIVSHGAYPSPLNYKGFPKSICTSVNEVICHGIPSASHFLKEGDIINVDVTVTLDGYFGDTSKTFHVGEVTLPQRIKVCEAAAEGLARAMATVRHGARLGDIGAAIQGYAEGLKLGVVRDFVGHGIGKVFHEEPQICHYGRAGSGARIVRGMCFTIEPMINGGDWRHRLLSDGWTAITVDGEPSAQFEHTLAVVEDGIEVLTALPGDAISLRALELGARILWPNDL